MTADIEKTVVDDGLQTSSHLTSSFTTYIKKARQYTPRIPSLRLPSSSQQLGETAYLDGLRGFACLLVYFQHHNILVHEGGKELENAFGYNGLHYFTTLPFIRLLFTGGHLAVTVFFVISGYVLSAKPLSLVHAEQYEKLSENLASALFRRWIRLYLPLIATTFIYMSVWHILGLTSHEKKMQSSYLAEIWQWYCDVKNFSFVFSTQDSTWFKYNSHLWSIPVEFKGSILIYTSIMAFSRCTRNARLWCQVALIWYFMYVVDGSYSAMFAAGMLLCDLDMLAKKDRLPDFLKRLEPFKVPALCHLLIVALYFGGVPSWKIEMEILRKNFGWYWLSHLKPQAVYDYRWFFLFWASTIIVAAVTHIDLLRRFFERRTLQFLGRVSYGFYLVHGPVLNTIGERLYAAVGWQLENRDAFITKWQGLMPIPRFGPKGLELSLLLPQLILLPLTLWLAELVTRGIDKPSVRFAQKLYRRTLAPAPSLKP